MPSNHRGPPVRPSSAPLLRRNQQTLISAVGVKSVPVPGKEFDFVAAALASSVGATSADFHTAVNPTASRIRADQISTSKMPIGYDNSHGNSASGVQVKQSASHAAAPVLHKGPVPVQSSFYAHVEVPQSQKHSTADTEAAQKSELASSVANRVALMQLRRERLQQRIRPQSAQQRSTPLYSQAQTGGHPAVAVLGTVSSIPAQRSDTFVLGPPSRPTSAVQAVSEASAQLFTVGFDSRTAILDAAKSACLSMAPINAAAAAQKFFYDVDPHFGAQQQQHPLVGANDNAEHDSSALALSHKKTELMLSGVPLVGAGMRALLLASEDNVSSVAGGVMVLAQVLAMSVASQRDMQQMKRRGVIKDPAAKSPDPPHKGEAWRVVYAAGGGDKHSTISAVGAADGSLEAGSDNFDDTVNGSALRIRGRPHSAPLIRGDTSSPPRDYLKELMMRKSPTGAAKPRAGAVRPQSALSIRPTSSKAKPINSVAATSASPPVVLASTDSKRTTLVCPEWLDPRGLIGVSVDPRYQQPGGGTTGSGREGFAIFGSSIGSPSPSRTAGLNQSSGSVEAAAQHYKSFSSATTLSAIREARSKADQRHRGVLRGGAGFLMFSASIAPPAGINAASAATS